MFSQCGGYVQFCIHQGLELDKKTPVLGVKDWSRVIKHPLLGSYSLQGDCSIAVEIAPHKGRYLLLRDLVQKCGNLLALWSGRESKKSEITDKKSRIYSYAAVRVCLGLDDAKEFSDKRDKQSSQSRVVICKNNPITPLVYVAVGPEKSQELHKFGGGRCREFDVRASIEISRCEAPFAIS